MATLKRVICLTLWFYPTFVVLEKVFSWRGRVTGSWMSLTKARLMSVKEVWMGLQQHLMYTVVQYKGLMGWYGAIFSGGIHPSNICWIIRQSSSFPSIYLLFIYLNLYVHTYWEFCKFDKYVPFMVILLDSWHTIFFRSHSL